MKKYFGKILFVGLALVLVAAGCNKKTVQTSQPIDSAQVQDQTPSTPAVPSGQTQTKQNADAPDYKAPQPDQSNQIHVKQQVLGSSEKVAIAYSVAQGNNALALLKMGHKVETKSFGDAGEFVESIDGIKPDSQHFWSFYVNAKQSSVGASSYTLKDGDSIEWKQEVINN